MAEKVVATIRKRAREEVETVPAIYMDALYLSGSRLLSFDSSSIKTEI